jgi:hypothetical protein
MKIIEQWVVDYFLQKAELQKFDKNRFLILS